MLLPCKMLGSSFSLRVSLVMLETPASVCKLCVFVLYEHLPPAGGQASLSQTALGWWQPSYEWVAHSLHKMQCKNTLKVRWHYKWLRKESCLKEKKLNNYYKYKSPISIDESKRVLSQHYCASSGDERSPILLDAGRRKSDADAESRRFNAKSKLFKALYHSTK
jgi:hypothetical protein